MDEHAVGNDNDDGDGHNKDDDDGDNNENDGDNNENDGDNNENDGDNNEDDGDGEIDKDDDDGDNNENDGVEDDDVEMEEDGEGNRIISTVDESDLWRTATTITCRTWYRCTCHRQVRVLTFLTRPNKAQLVKTRIFL